MTGRGMSAEDRGVETLSAMAATDQVKKPPVARPESIRSQSRFSTTGLILPGLGMLVGLLGGLGAVGFRVPSSFYSRRGFIPLGATLRRTFIPCPGGGCY